MDEEEEAGGLPETTGRQPASGDSEPGVLWISAIAVATPPRGDLREQRRPIDSMTEAGDRQRKGLRVAAGVAQPDREGDE